VFAAAKIVMDREKVLALSLMSLMPKSTGTANCALKPPEGSVSSASNSAMLPST